MSYSIHAALRALLIGACILVTSHTSAQAAIVIGGWNEQRAEIAAIDTGFLPATMRFALEDPFPGTTYVSTYKLTPEFLAGVDVAILTSARGWDSSVGSLSGAEQTALLNYVKAGGAALIATDGDFTSSANQSFVAPFKITLGDYIGGTTTGVVTTPSPLTNGPYGTIDHFNLYTAGSYSKLGPYALPLATGKNGNVVLAVIPHDAISPGSGPVVFISSPEPLMPGLYGNGPELIRNTIAYLVPEPSTIGLALSGAGMLCVAVLARRGRRPRR